MSRCRYNLSEECHNKECVKCILEKIKTEFSNLQKAHHIWLIDQDALIDECSEIIDKYISELKKGEENA